MTKWLVRLLASKVDSLYFLGIAALIFISSIPAISVYVVSAIAVPATGWLIIPALIGGIFYSIFVVEVAAMVRNES